MPALVYAYPECEGAVRTWVRALNLAGLGARAYFGIPVKGAVFPLVVLSRVGGRPMRGVPIDRPLIQFDILGDTPVDRRPPSDKFALGGIAASLAGTADSITSGTVVAPGVVCLGAEVENGPVWSPSPVDGRSRYVLDVSFNLRLA